MVGIYLPALWCNHAASRTVLRGYCKTREAMTIRGIPVIQPIPLHGDQMGPMGSSQPIIQFKELTVDIVRYNEWKEEVLRANHNKQAKIHDPRRNTYDRNE